MELFKSRPRVVYTNKVGDKVYPVVVDIKKGIKSTEDIQFVSSDVNTGILSVAFIQGNDNYNVTGADVVCSVMRPDASTLELPCEVVGENIVEVPLGINGTSQDGVYSFDFKVLKGGNKVIGTPIMNYSVSLSIGNDMVVEEDDRLPVLTMLMTQVTELKDEAGEVINQANTATEASKVATAKAIEATANANAVSERVSQETSEAISRVDNKVNEVETRFNALTTSQQQDAEVIDARDGEVSLKARLDRDLYKDGISLSDRIEAIEGLKDSQNMKYETDKGYLVCKETKNGVIDDLKIEGNTLVNRFLPKSVGDDRLTTTQVTPLSEYRVQTFINLTGREVTVGYYNYSGVWLRSRVVRSGEIFISSSSTEYVKDVIGFFGNGFTSSDTFNVMLLEGDHTQNPPSYFEGLMSVGQDVDKIEVLSNNGNLFDMSRVLYGKSINSNNGDIATTPDWCVNEEFIPVVKGVPLYISRGESISNASSTKGYIYVYQYNKNKVMIGRLEVGTTSVTFTPTINGFIRVALKYDKLIGFGLYRQPNISMPHQSDKKQILFYNENGELEPIQELHEWDSIEKHSDNKWYYHKRSGKVVLNGSEYWQEGLSSQFTDTHMYFACNSFDSIMKDSSLISDKFENKPTWDILSRECIDSATSMDKLRIRLAKSKLSTQDVTGFKQWLQANNVTVVYQLAQEEVYEIAPLHLDSYANETLILCNSGAISPKMEFSITSHINELVKSQGDRISLLEEKMYKALKQVLAGDMYSLAELLYPEDFVEENPENEIMLLPFE